jgi:hypothetical protein
LLYISCHEMQKYLFTFVGKLGENYENNDR